MRLIIVAFIFFVNCSYGQLHLSLDTIKPPNNYENIYARPVYHDSLLSGFVIFIKKEVKLHKHMHHSEQVVVLEGEGKMQLGAETIYIKKGDVVLIPKNTPHAVVVTSTIPMKVLSTQSPYFDGTDRIMLD